MPYKDKRKLYEAQKRYRQRGKERQKKAALKPTWSLRETLDSMYDRKVEPVKRLRERAALKDQVLVGCDKALQVSDQLVEHGLLAGFNFLANAYLIIARSMPDVSYQELHNILVGWFTNIAKGTEDRGTLMVCALGTARKAITGLLDKPNLDPEIESVVKLSIKSIDETVEYLRNKLDGSTEIFTTFDNYLQSLEQKKLKR